MFKNTLKMIVPFLVIIQNVNLNLKVDLLFKNT
jgi:hypothetical protein